MILQEQVGRRGLLNVNFGSGLQKTLLRTFFADNPSLIPKVACAWSAFQTNVLHEKPLLAQYLPKQLLLGLTRGGRRRGAEHHPLS